MNCPDVPMPKSIAKLPRDERGFPVPFFAPPKVDGKYVFTSVSPTKRKACAFRRLCWICGGDLLDKLAFVGGPRCLEQGAFIDGPCHIECATYAMRACPWLAMPEYKRRSADVLKANHPHHIVPEKPEYHVIYVTNGYRVTTGDGWVFLALPPIEVQKWKEGKRV